MGSENISESTSDRCVRALACVCVIKEQRGKRAKKKTKQDWELELSIFGCMRKRGPAVCAWAGEGEGEAEWECGSKVVDQY